GWPLWAFWRIAGSLPLLAAFVLYERTVAVRTGAPLLELSLFRHRAFTVGLIVILTFFSGISMFFMMLTIYLQSGLHFSALDVGLVLSPFAVGFFLASVASVKVAPLLGTRTLNVAAGLMCLSLGTTIRIIGSRGASLHMADLLLVLFSYGAGQGLMVSPLFNIIMSGAVGADAGSASGTLSTIQQVAGSIGVAAMGTVFFSLLGRNPRVIDFETAITRTLRYNIMLIALTFLLVFLLPRNSNSAS
ncbi:MAG TPA: MFS transporter, partial [Blastocatellia bacterium]|nr:MFS transporter [Blastocatellia bacterium]